ncbi:MAG: nucleoside monophosphate kinase [Phycisphaerales bacterium]|nr:nucleoside monophosphate kinase [Phycisphaerales bacterium]
MIYNTILLFGAPGVGKGMQGHLLGNIPGFYHFSSGEMFRSLDKQSELGREFNHYSTQGLLVPDDLTVRLWTQYIEQRISAGDYKPDMQLLLLDGIPRTVQQAQAMAPHMQVLKVIHLLAGDENVMVQRMKRRALMQHRPDDADEAVIRRRFEVYHAQTQPMLDHYPAELVADIDAVGSPARVLRDVLRTLVPVLDRHCKPWEG